jgi:hypothetical protein
MADDTLLIPAHVSRRDRLVAQRRRRRRRVVVVVATVLLVGGSATAFALTREHDPTHAGSATPAAKVESAGAPTVPPVKNLQPKTPPRLLTHDAPLDLWVGGDSLAGGLGPALGQIAGATGVVHTQVDYKVSSGLADNGVRNWQERATEAMAQYDPEVVVFEIGTNDAAIVNSHVNADGVPEWEPQYRSDVAQIMDTLRGPAGHRRTVFWVGAPPMSVSWRDKGVQELDRVFREEAEKRSHDVHYVDMYKLFSGENGGYTSTLRTLSGDVERVRISDGVHLTEAGANYIGAIVFALLDKRFAIEAHQDPSQPINWEESSGSSGNSSSGSGSRSGSGSSHHNGGGSGSSGNGTEGTAPPPPSLATTAPPNTAPASTAPATSPATEPPATGGGSASTTPSPGSTTPTT